MPKQTHQEFCALAADGMTHDFPSTACVCAAPGYCARHHCRKTVYHHHLCRTNGELFAAWEAGHGPGQSNGSTENGRHSVHNPIIPCSFSGGRHGRLTRDLTVAVIVISHNYGRYLSECLESVLRQSSRPHEILVVDDASDDDTFEVSQHYRTQVRYLRVDVRNVHKARRAGMEATNASVLCFLDADDKLGEDYLGAGLRGFTDDAIAVVYSDVRKFGGVEGHSTYPETFNRDLLATDNYLHAGSLVLREALVQSRVFERVIDPLVTQGDWFLWRHVLYGAWRANKQTGLYWYRQHASNWTHAMRRAARGYFEYAGLNQETLTLVVPLSGRVERWSELHRYLERQSWPHPQIQLLLLDTSGNEAFSRPVRVWIAECDYPDVRHVRITVSRPGLADEDRRQEEIQRDVRLAMSRIYAFAAAATATDYVWILEDDILPPDDVAERLLRGFDEHTASVSAAYASRFDRQPCVWDQHRQHYRTIPTGLGVVHGNGFGCVVLRGAVLRQIVFRHEDDFDRAFYDQVNAQNWIAKVDWSLRCRHGDVEMSSESPGCSCAQPGWCARHRCLKTVLQHHLCRTDPVRFSAWEQERAHLPDVPAPEEPGLVQKAWNFGKAMIRHAADGGRHVDEAVYTARLDTCRSCTMCDVPRMVCREQTCGCQLHLKARWHSERCPLGKWPDPDATIAETICLTDTSNELKD